MVRTYWEVFGSVSIVRDERGGRNGNEILLARITTEPLKRQEVVRAASELTRKKSFSFDLGRTAAKGFFQPNKATARGRVLLDADAPN